ncbi:MAG TPA: ATP-dependent DNA ligase [Bauldia sp.]|nr:ATP-dependent DNA ligase [Bauldia sp.]
MLLNDLVDASSRVRATSGRLAKIGHLADLLRRAGPDEIAIAVSYLSGEVRQGRIGVGYAALRDAAGSPAAIPSLTLDEVDRRLGQIMATRGAGSAGERRRLLAEFFGKATSAEQEFLFLLVIGELRQGALEGIMIEAIARAAGLPAAEIRRAVMVSGELAPVAEAALAEGRGGLGRFSVEVFRPLRPMLAQTAEDAEDALRRFSPAGFEYKLDGARVQVHKAGGEVRIFTRELNDVTTAAPEIVEAVEALAADSLILDGEAISFRPDGKPQPFQVTMRRFGRKLDVAAMRGSLPLSALFFDCLYLDGRTLIDEPQNERAAALTRALPSELRVPRLVTGDPEAAGAFIEEALTRGHEGVMAKALDATYEAGARGAGWLKIKRAHTLDLAVLAAEWGHGRRRGWLSNLHLGAYDPESGGFVMLGKTFKGMTDEMLAWQTERLQALATESDGHVVHVRPELLVEVAFNDIQASPHGSRGRCRSCPPPPGACPGGSP